MRRFCQVIPRKSENNSLNALQMYVDNVKKVQAGSKCTFTCSKTDTELISAVFFKPVVDYYIKSRKCDIAYIISPSVSDDKYFFTKLNISDETVRFDNVRCNYRKGRVHWWNTGSTRPVVMRYVDVHNSLVSPRFGRCLTSWCMQ